MYCRNCKTEVSEKSKVCPGCGCDPLDETKFCQECGSETTQKQKMCTKCGCELVTSVQTVLQKESTGNSKDWMTTLLLNIFLGYLGVHRFYTGHSGIGVIQLLTFGGCGIWTLIDFIEIVTHKFKDSEGNLLVKS